MPNITTNHAITYTNGKLTALKIQTDIFFKLNFGITKLLNLFQGPTSEIHNILLLLLLLLLFYT